jgi:hypothetical protein
VLLAHGQRRGELWPVAAPAALDLDVFADQFPGAAAETGSNPFQIAAVLAHKSARSAMHYTQGADRKRMARTAMKRLISGNGG